MFLGVMLLIGKVWELGCQFQGVAMVSAAKVPRWCRSGCRDDRGAARLSSAWMEGQLSSAEHV